MSWKPEIAFYVPDVWISNGLRFPTREEAEASVLDLAIRSSAVEDWRVVECDDPANYRYCGGRLEGIH
jgi:hypothetical protein